MMIAELPENALPLPAVALVLTVGATVVVVGVDTGKHLNLLAKVATDLHVTQINLPAGSHHANLQPLRAE